MIEIPLTRGFVAIIDDEDAHLAEFKWFAKAGSGGSVYAVRNKSLKDGPRGTIFLHHEVMGRPPRGRVVDHINDPTTDCRRANLRVVTKRTNVRNRTGAQKGRKSSPYLGVSYRKERGTWRAHIKLNGRQLFLGSFPTAEIANAARLAAEKKLWGVQPRRKAAHQGTL